MSASEIAAWMSAISAAAAALTAFLTLRIAAKQSKATERQLQIDLYGPRCEIYNIVSFVESEVFTHGKARPAFLRSIADNLQRTEHLFGIDAKQELVALSDQLIEWEMASARHEPGDSPSMSDRMRQLRTTKQNLLSKMRPYLTLYDISRTPPSVHPLGWVDDVLDWIERKSR